MPVSFCRSTSRGLGRIRISTAGRYLAIFTSNKTSAKWRAWYALSAEEKRARDAVGLPSLAAWDAAHRDVIVYAV